MSQNEHIHPKVIFVTGGVLSSLGKGITAASLGALLESRGFKVHIRKFEPYLNVDPGTMSPYQHGEVFVTDDGAETDLDLGHYERFTSINTTRADAVSTGQVYAEVIAKERRGDYLGATVQVIPHVTDTIQDYILRDVQTDTDFLLVEIGGTVGDIEGLPYIESIRQFAIEYGRENVMFLHLTLLPYVKAAGELKTKPTQHSVKTLQSMGIQPDILVLRSEVAIADSERDKLALFCNVKKSRIIEAPDVDTIYEVPLKLRDGGLDAEVCTYFGLEQSQASNAYPLEKWEGFVETLKRATHVTKIAIVGKYTELSDAYKSLTEALIHASTVNETKLEIMMIQAEDLEQSDSTAHLNLQRADAILVPGGYGARGTNGKLKAIQYARENHVPFFGICLGMQLAVIEFARNVAHLKNAGSTELSTPENPIEHPIVGLMTEWETTAGEKVTRDDHEDLGGTMRLGAYPCTIKENTLAHAIYNRTEIQERHRHRYEVNMNYRTQLESHGLHFTGLSPDGTLPEIVELQDHPWFFATQFHPEFKSRPHDPHPIFTAFVKAAVEHSLQTSRHQQDAA